MKTANIYDPGATENDYLFMFNGEPVSGTGPVPTGTIQITSNGQHDVSDYATADVNVPQGITPSGSTNITENGTYDVTQYASAVVNVPQGGGGTSDMNGWTNGVKYTDLTIIQNEYINNINGNFETYAGWSRTGYVPINGASFLILPAMSGTGGDTKYNAFYTESHAFISAFNIKHGTKSVVAVPSNAYYFALSETSNMLNEVITNGVIPIE